MVTSTGFIFGLICGGGLILIFAAIGIYLIYSSYKSRQKAGESQQWPSTSGEITEARVTHSTHTDADDNRIDSYSPYVRFTYQVSGQEFTGDKITFGLKQAFNQEQKAQQALGRYQMGGQVSVYYNPDNPKEAVLERSAGNSSVSLIIGIVFIVISICIGCPVVGALLYNLLSTQG